MSSQIGVTLGKLTSALQTAGVFVRVKTVEPKAPPGDGITAAVYLSAISLIPGLSGLNNAAGLYEFTLRVYSNALREPADQIDPELVKTVDKVWDLFFGDLDLGETVMAVDVLGAYSQGLRARAGHVDVAGVVFRAVDITIPLVVDGVFAEVI